jgi:hypothetical protein
LQDRLVVLVLVLEHHLVDVAVPHQRIHRIEICDSQTPQHPAPDLIHDLAAAHQRWEWERSPLASGVLKRIEEPGHLDKLYGALKVTRQPELLEVGDMTQVPQDRAHQGVMLSSQLVVIQGSKEQKRPVSGFEELVGYESGIEPAGGDRSHGISGGLVRSSH